MRKYQAVATGGTFDHIHKGHRALLAKSFETGDLVIIGVASDELAEREGKHPDQNYEERVRKLRLYLARTFPGRKFVIAKLDDYFGPGIASPEVRAIVASPETVAKVPIANELRSAKGFPPLAVVVVDYVLAEDGKRISSTRIRNGEIDTDGGVLKRHRGAKRLLI
jgi:pantetheine-phosphate adenylyltransferase